MSAGLLDPRAAPPHVPRLIEKARRLWLQGHSTALIAMALTTPARTVTKNAVVGIAHRNDFPPRPSPIRRKAVA